MKYCKVLKNKLFAIEKKFIAVEKPVIIKSIFAMLSILQHEKLCHIEK